jgi:hypothetical protein
LLCILLLVAVACGPSESACEDLEAAASQRVLDAVSVDQECVLDEDCVVVGVNGSCFDSCSRVIAAANQGVFDQAIADAEANECADYGGCTLIIPPCAPPEPAVCGASGVCEGG